MLLFGRSTFCSLAASVKKVFDEARRIAAKIGRVAEETLTVLVYRTLKPIMCRPT
jgi:hypothetical protein